MSEKKKKKRILKGIDFEESLRTYKTTTSAMPPEYSPKKKKKNPTDT